MTNDNDPDKQLIFSVLTKQLESALNGLNNHALTLLLIASCLDSTLESGKMLAALGAQVQDELRMIMAQMKKESTNA